MIVPLADGARLYPLEMPNLASHLLALPEALEAERDTTPLRGIDFAIVRMTGDDGQFFY